MYAGGGPEDDVAHNIRNEQRYRGADKNTPIACDSCGDRYPWHGYWKPRVNNMHNPRKEDWLCDDCRHRRQDRKRKMRRHKQLAEWSK